MASELDQESSAATAQQPKKVERLKVAAPYFVLEGGFGAYDGNINCRRNLPLVDPGSGKIIKLEIRSLDPEDWEAVRLDALKIQAFHQEILDKEFEQQ